MNQPLILDVLQALVVIATGVLAFFTWRLARSTSKSVDELKEERKVTIRVLDASNRIAAAAETELEATHKQVAASQILAEEAVRERTARWEPVLSARLAIVPGNRPTSVVLENFGTGPALDVVYTVVVADPAGLKAWFLVGPLNLHADSIQELELNAVYCIEQASYEASDTSSVVNGVPVRRFVRRFTRAFEGDLQYHGQTTDPREQFGWR